MDQPFFNTSNIQITGGDATGLETLSGEYSLPPVSGGAISNAGTTGSTTRSYFWKVVLNDGREAFSPIITTTTANATLSVSNYSRLTCDAYEDAWKYFLYRSASAGTPSTTGLIAESDSPAVNDTGLAAATGVFIPDRSTGGALATFDTIRVGDYVGDPAARIGVQGDVDINGALRCTKPDGWWTTGTGVQLQYIAPAGHLMSFNYDTTAFVPTILNYGGNGVASPVLVGRTSMDSSGAFMLQTGNGGIWSDGDMKVTGAASIPSGGSSWLAAVSITKTIADLTGANSAVAAMQSTASFTQVTGANTSSLYGSNDATSFAPTSTGGSWTQSTTVGKAVFAYFAGTMTNNATTGISTLIGQSAALGMNGVSPVGLITLASALEIGSWLKSASGSPSVTVTNLRGLAIQDMGSGSGAGGFTATSVQGLAIAAQTTSTNRYDIQIGGTSIPTGGAWSLYQSSATRNAIVGKTYFGAATDATARIHVGAGTATANTAPVQVAVGVSETTARSGLLQFSSSSSSGIQAVSGSRWTLTESDTTERYILQAATSAKTTAGAPYANDGYVSAVINGSTVRLMTTA